MSTRWWRTRLIARMLRGFWRVTRSVVTQRNPDASRRVAAEEAAAVLAIRDAHREQRDREADAAWLRRQVERAPGRCWFPGDEW